MSDPITAFMASASKIARRSFAGGFYLACLGLGLLAAPDFYTPEGRNLLVLFPFLLVLGMIIAHGTYEIILPLHRAISIPLIMDGFQNVTGSDSAAASLRYNDLSALRRALFNSGQFPSAEEGLNKDLELRQFLSYLFASTLAGTMIVLPVAIFMPERRLIASIELGVTLFMLVLATLGHRNRSRALGISYGKAYVDSLKERSSRFDSGSRWFT